MVPPGATVWLWIVPPSGLPRAGGKNVSVSAPVARSTRDAPGSASATRAETQENRRPNTWLPAMTGWRIRPERPAAAGIGRVDDDGVIRRRGGPVGDAGASVERGEGGPVAGDHTAAATARVGAAGPATVCTQDAPRVDTLPTPMTLSVGENPSLVALKPGWYQSMPPPRG